MIALRITGYESLPVANAPWGSVIERGFDGNRASPSEIRCCLHAGINTKLNQPTPSSSAA